jgi:hypothetical protein
VVTSAIDARVQADQRYASPARSPSWQNLGVTYPDEQFMLRAALNGFDGARERCHDAITARASAEHVFVPLSEALWWIVIVDDGFEALAGANQGYRPTSADYRAARDAHPDGKALRALRYARDRCGHQRALVVAVRLLTLPFSLPATLGPTFRWRPSGDLPPPDPRFHNPALQSEYDRILAGQQAEVALSAAASWFVQERNRAGL